MIAADDVSVLFCCLRPAVGEEPVRAFASCFHDALSYINVYPAFGGDSLFLFYFRRVGGGSLVSFFPCVCVATEERQGK